MSVEDLIKRRLSKSLYYRAYSRAFYTMCGVVWKEVRVSVRQFFTWRYPIRSLWRTLTIIASSLNRLVLGRSVKFSYAYTGEDRIIESILKPNIRYEGFYVEVGCNHPVFLSNTYALYRKGWRGVCIDANNKLIKKYAHMRPRDKAVCALVSDTVTERSFYLIENNVLSTTEHEVAQTIQHLEQSVVTMKTQTLTSILEGLHVPSRFDLLSIDTEEHDLHVLRSLDFSRYAPSLVVIEDENFKYDSPAIHPIVMFMSDHGYQLAGYVLKNLYFTRINT